MNSDFIAFISASVGGGFFGGILVGYALKKVVKLIAVVVGLFLAGLAYLQYQQLASVNWAKVEGTILTYPLAASSTKQTIRIKRLSFNSNNPNSIKLKGASSIQNQPKLEKRKSKKALRINGF